LEVLLKVEMDAGVGKVILIIVGIKQIGVTVVVDIVDLESIGDVADVAGMLSFFHPLK
jgi:hypothetical protein